MIQLIIYSFLDKESPWLDKFEKIFRPGLKNDESKANLTKIIGSGLKYELATILTNYGINIMYPYMEQKGVHHKYITTG